MKHSSNSFSSLGQETTDRELKNDRELRNTYKKHKKKQQKYELNPSEDLLREINILEILIKEYVDSQKGPQKQKKSKKNKKRKTSSCSEDSDDFLEKEFQKNKDFNNKRFKQQKEDEEKKKKEKQERQKEEEEEWERRRQRKSYYESPEDKNKQSLVFSKITKLIFIIFPKTLPLFYIIMIINCIRNYVLNIIPTNMKVNHTSSFSTV